MPTQTRFILRGGPDALRAARSPFGAELPANPCQAVVQSGRAALWLGPDEQLLLAGDGEQESLSESIGRALAPFDYALVDISHRQHGFEASGPRAAVLLNSGCPLDLHIARFPIGMCTRTVFSKAEIVLWRTAPNAFRIEVWRSFVAYFLALWAQAARDDSG